MKNIGILGAMTIHSLGAAPDVECFFKAIVMLLEGGEKGSRYPFITVRLYSHSLKKDEMHELKRSLESVRAEFSKISARDFDATSVGVDEKSTRLILNSDTIASVFANYFEALLDAIECSYVFYEEFKEYVPLRIGFTDVPDYIYDVNRSDELYESIGADELPFWLR